MILMLQFKTHTVWYEFVVQWINTYSTRGKIIWSCIFQPCDLVRHFPGPAFSRSCIFSSPPPAPYLWFENGRQWVEMVNKHVVKPTFAITDVQRQWNRWQGLSVASVITSRAWWRQKFPLRSSTTEKSLPPVLIELNDLCGNYRRLAARASVEWATRVWANYRTVSTVDRWHHTAKQQASAWVYQVCSWCCLYLFYKTMYRV